MVSKNATFSPGSLELLDNDPFLSCYTPFELFNPFWAGPPGQKCVILHALIESFWITFPEQKWLRESFNRASKKHVTLHSPGWWHLSRNESNLRMLYCLPWSVAFAYWCWSGGRRRRSRCTPSAAPSAPPWRAPPPPPPRRTWPWSGSSPLHVKGVGYYWLHTVRVYQK